jgi:hypothetical protein
MSVQHVSHFIALGIMLRLVTLFIEVVDSMSWKLTPIGIYSSSSAHLVQFKISPASNMNGVVWKTSHAIFFARLVIQNTMWAYFNAADGKMWGCREMVSNIISLSISR